MVGRFIGNDFLGFKHGNLYYLKSKVENVYVDGRIIPCICLYDINSKVWCPYKDLESLLCNWEFAK